MAEECSQSSQLVEEDPRKLGEDSISSNTKKQRLWGLQKFEQWCQRRNIICDLADVDATPVDPHCYRQER